MIILTQSQQENTHWKHNFCIKNIRSSQFSSFFLICIDKMLLHLQSISLTDTITNAYLISRWMLLTHSFYTELTHLQFLKIFLLCKTVTTEKEKDKTLISNVVRKEIRHWQILRTEHWTIKYIQGGPGWCNSKLQTLLPNMMASNLTFV